MPRSKFAYYRADIANGIGIDINSENDPDITYLFYLQTTLQNFTQFSDITYIMQKRLGISMTRL